VSTFLGLLGVVAFIPCVVALAAGMTWLVVRYSPTQNGGDSAGKPTGSS
jgi:hypothetical protein